MTNKISQEKCCFLIMYQAAQHYIPTYKFVGEIVVLETSKMPQMNVFLSYKAPVRLSDLYYELDQVERRQVIGKSGARYYEYRLMHRDLDKLPEEYRKLI